MNQTKKITNSHKKYNQSHWRGYFSFFADNFFVFRDTTFSIASRHETTAGKGRKRKSSPATNAFPSFLFSPRAINRVGGFGGEPGEVGKEKSNESIAEKRKILPCQLRISPKGGRGQNGFVKRATASLDFAQFSIFFIFPFFSKL